MAKIGPAEGSDGDDGGGDSGSSTASTAAEQRRRREEELKEREPDPVEEDTDAAREIEEAVDVEYQDSAEEQGSEEGISPESGPDETVPQASFGSESERQTLASQQQGFDPLAGAKNARGVEQRDFGDETPVIGNEEVEDFLNEMSGTYSEGARDLGAGVGNAVEFGATAGVVNPTGDMRPSTVKQNQEQAQAYGRTAEAIATGAAQAGNVFEVGVAAQETAETGAYVLGGDVVERSKTAAAQAEPLAAKTATVATERPLQFGGAIVGGAVTGTAIAGASRAGSVRSLSRSVDVDSDSATTMNARVQTFLEDDRAQMDLGSSRKQKQIEKTVTEEVEAEQISAERGAEIAEVSEMRDVSGVRDVGRASPDPEMRGNPLAETAEERLPSREVFESEEQYQQQLQEMRQRILQEREAEVEEATALLETEQTLAGATLAGSQTEADAMEQEAATVLEAEQESATAGLSLLAGQMERLGTRAKQRQSLLGVQQTTQATTQLAKQASVQQSTQVADQLAKQVSTQKSSQVADQLGQQVGTTTSIFDGGATQSQRRRIDDDEGSAPDKDESIFGGLLDQFTGWETSVADPDDLVDSWGGDGEDVFSGWF